MKCPRCQHDNPPHAKFCLECGARFGVTCSRCGAELPSSAKFCLECGEVVGTAASAPSPQAYTPRHLAEKILTSRSALEGERKQVTVLFADVKGSMDLAEQVDPEEWHRIMDRFFQILADGVHRFEGTVNQYTGDGMMALFGAPIAHEDHAQRACYAALHLTDELRRYADELRLTRGLSFAVRMGLNSGEVVVGKIGDDLRMDYTAQGLTVGLAARMEQIAEPRSIYLTDHAARLISGYFQLRDLGQTKLEGVREPIRVYELQGAGRLRTRLEASRTRGLSCFVGRTHEMQALETALAQALEGHGQVVGIVGEAGVGKSRLCLEFVERCRARATPVYDAHCPAHGRTIPFLPILQLFRGYFGITEQDGDEEARRKIAGTLVLLDESFHEALPLVFNFLSVPDPERPPPPTPPEAGQRQLYALVRRIVQARSVREPAVLLVDDLHWIDGASDGVLAQLVEVVSGTRTMLLVNFRPEYQAAWTQKSYYQQLPLLPLGPEAIDELLGDLLGTDPSLVGVADLIRQRTGGNPFFIEEVAQSLVESESLEGLKGDYRLVRPVGTLAIPATVQVVLAARIDRLAECEKELLQTAAVVGKQFSEQVLCRVAEPVEAELTEALANLARAEFIYQEALYPEAEYAFKHPLTQEVAYGSQLAERRARVHAAVARAIEEVHPEDLDERAALLARHWQAAGEPVLAARWSARAASWAVRGDPAAALEHWRRVRDLLQDAPQSDDTEALRLAACNAILDLGWRVGIPAEEAAAVFAEGRTITLRREDLRSLAILTGAYGGVRGVAGSLAKHREHCEEAVHLADRTDDTGLQVASRFRLFYVFMLAGPVREMLRVTDEMQALCQGDVKLGAEIVGLSPFVASFVGRADALWALGRLRKAREEAERGVQLAARCGEDENLSIVHAVLAIIATLSGDGDEATLHARRAAEIAEKVQTPFATNIACLALALAHLLQADWDAAVAASEKALAIARTHNTGRELEAWVLASLAQAALGCGDLQRARRTAEEAVAVATRGGQRAMEITAQLALARVLIWTEGANAKSAIETALARATSLIEETGAAVHRSFVHLERAALAGLLDDKATYQRELHEAHRLFTEMGATGHAERLARDLEST